MAPRRRTSPTGSCSPKSLAVAPWLGAAWTSHSASIPCIKGSDRAGDSEDLLGAKNPEIRAIDITAQKTYDSWFPQYSKR